MRIAFLVVRFPVAAETPFLNQVTGQELRASSPYRATSGCSSGPDGRSSAKMRTSCPCASG